MLLCSMSESIYVVSENPFACFKSFITWASIAHSVSIFLHPVCYVVLPIACIHSQNYMLHEQTDILTFDFSMRSILNKVVSNDYHQRSKGQSAHATYNFEHECMVLAIQHSKLDATKIDTECAIFLC